MVVNKDLNQTLYDNPTNMANYRQLKDTFNTKKFIAYLGAGIPANTAGIPPWEGLHTHLCKEYDITVLYNKDKPKECFSELYETIEDRSEFDNKVFSKVKSPDSLGPMDSQVVARIFSRYVTTNYYDPVEEGWIQIQKARGVREPRRPKRYYFRFPELLGKPSEHTITYLHGHHDIGFCILRSKDYGYFYPSLHEKNAGVYVVENTLRYIFTRYHVVFLGCSLEDDLISFMRIIDAQENKKPLHAQHHVKDHYWITDESDLVEHLKGIREDKRLYEQDYFDKYMSAKISPILYSGGHRAISTLLDSLIVEPNEQPDVSQIGV